MGKENFQRPIDDRRIRQIEKEKEEQRKDIEQKKKEKEEENVSEGKNETIIF
jgi:hypothetical protein